MRAIEHQRRPRLRGLVSLGLLALALAGCGKGQLTQTSTTVTAVGSGSAAPGAGSEQGRAPSPKGAAKMEKLAAAINLRASDLPGFNPSTKHKEAETPREKALSKKSMRCLGETASSETKSFEAASPSFERSASVLTLTARSEVTFAPSAQAAAAQLALIRSAKARSCFQSYVQELFAGGQFKGAKESKLQIQSGTPPTPGMVGGFALRMTTSFAIHGLRLPIYLDLFGFVKGDAQITLFTSGLLTTFPAREEERLFKLLLERARAHL